jgi:hypothetical protein
MHVERPVTSSARASRRSYFEKKEKGSTHRSGHLQAPRMRPISGKATTWYPASMKKIVTLDPRPADDVLLSQELAATFKERIAR